MILLYDYCKKIILDLDNKYKYLIEFCENSSSKVDSEVKKEIALYIDGLDSFYEKYINDILDYKNYIAYNYFRYLSIFYEYGGLPRYSIYYLQEFRKSTIRTIEIALFLQSKNLDINHIFFNKKHQTFYENFLQMYGIDFSKNKISLQQNKDVKSIEKAIKIYKDDIVIKEGEKDYRFKSTVKRPVGYKNKATLYLFLRLQEKAVYDVFTLRVLENRGDRDGIGGNPLNLVPLDSAPKRISYENKLSPFLKQEFEKMPSTPIADNDEAYESSAKSNKRIICADGTLCTIKNSVKEYNRYVDDSENIKLSENEKSKYKKIKIDKAIGHLAAKQNLHLPSKYTVPPYKLLARFLNNIQNKKSFEYKIILCSIVLGIEYQRILNLLLGAKTEIELLKNMIRVQLTTAYADTKKFNIFKQSRKEIEYELPAYILQLIKEIKEDFFKKIEKSIQQHNALLGNELKQEFYTAKTPQQLYDFMCNHFEEDNIKSITDTLMGRIQDNLVIFLKSEKKNFPKKIQINLRNLHTYSYEYYSQLHIGSNIDFLFMKNKTANIHTKLAYVQTPKRLLNMSYWIIELLEILGIDKTRDTSLKVESVYSGSDKLVDIARFKNFLKILISLKFDDRYANITVRMIYLRYVLSIFLTTRPYIFSASLQQYSKRENVIFIHEKAKNIYESKRVIPLTDLGVEYVEYFYKLRKCAQIDQYFPVIFNQHGVEELTTTNLTKWLFEHKNEIIGQVSEEDYLEIEHFFKDIIFDFGRHIFLSFAHNSANISQDYADAMVNHFEKGTQDQGMYSLFSNQKYFKEVRITMKEIEKKYIPYCKFLSEDNCNDL